MKNFRESLALRFVQLVFGLIVLALSFDLFMIGVHFTRPDLETKISNEIAWKIDGRFKNDPDNIWYESPKK